MNPLNEFYGEEYFRSHYGRLFDDSEYHSLLGEYWKHTLFGQSNLKVDGRVLDYGCGLGQVSCRLENVTLFDQSSYIAEWLRAQGRAVIGEPEKIQTHSYRYLISSHSLEHCESPHDLLRKFREYMEPGGVLILVLPIESDLAPRLVPDSNLHFYCWTFQTITNLLHLTGWSPISQRVIHNPYGLGKLRKFVSGRSAVRWASRLGNWKRNYPANLTIARLND